MFRTGLLNILFVTKKSSFLLLLHSIKRQPVLTGETMALWKRILYACFTYFNTGCFVRCSELKALCLKESESLRFPSVRQEPLLKTPFQSVITKGMWRGIGLLRPQLHTNKFFVNLPIKMDSMLMPCCGATHFCVLLLCLLQQKERVKSSLLKNQHVTSFSEQYTKVSSHLFPSPKLLSKKLFCQRRRTKLERNFASEEEKKNFS